jgi:hypothetical protein
MIDGATTASRRQGQGRGGHSEAAEGACRERNVFAPEPRLVFLAHSPYSVFLSIGLALSRPPGEPKDLFLYVTHPSVVRYVDGIAAWDGFPFRNVTRLDRALAGKPLLVKLAIMKRNIWRLRRALRTQYPSVMYFFNDTFPSCQFALAEAGRLFLRSSGCLSTKGAVPTANFDGAGRVE